MFAFTSKIPPFYPGSVSSVLAELTNVACSIIASTTKSLAERDETAKFLPPNWIGSPSGLNEYSMHISCGFLLRYQVVLSFDETEKHQRTNQHF